MKKEVDHLNITLSILTIVVLFAFALRPALVTALKLRKDINNYEELRNKLQEKLINLGRLNSLYETSQKDLGLLDTLIPNTPQEETLLKQISNKAILNSISITKIEYNFDNNTTNPKSLKIDVLADGGYNNLITFVHSLSSNPRIFEIDSLEFTKHVDKNTKNPVISLHLTGHTYYSLEGNND